MLKGGNPAYNVSVQIKLDCVQLSGHNYYQVDQTYHVQLIGEYILFI